MTTTFIMKEYTLLPRIWSIFVPARGSTDRFSGVKRLNPSFSSREFIKSFNWPSIASGSIVMPEKVSITRKASPVSGIKINIRTTRTISIALRPFLKFNFCVRYLC